MPTLPLFTPPARRAWRSLKFAPFLFFFVNRELKQATFLSTRTPTGNKSRRYRWRMIVSAVLVLNQERQTISQGGKLKPCFAGSASPIL